MNKLDLIFLFYFSGPDWLVPVPDTERLDSSVFIARAQLAQKAKRNPPSRDKLRESFRREVWTDTHSLLTAYV